MNEDTTEPLPDATLAQILAEVRALNGRMQAVETRLGTLEDKFDARSRETRPMSERIDQLVAAVAETRHELDEFRTETRQELRDINRTLRQINLTMARASWVQDDLETRVETLERRAGEEPALQS
jgi:chromosome segregation ATPase